MQRVDLDNQQDRPRGSVLLSDYTHFMYDFNDGIFEPIPTLYAKLKDLESCGNENPIPVNAYIYLPNVTSTTEINNPELNNLKKQIKNKLRERDEFNLLCKFICEFATLEELQIYKRDLLLKLSQWIKNLKEDSLRLDQAIQNILEANKTNLIKHDRELDFEYQTLKNDHEQEFKSKSLYYRLRYADSDFNNKLDQDAKNLKDLTRQNLTAKESQQNEECKKEIEKFEKIHNELNNSIDIAQLSKIIVKILKLGHKDLFQREIDSLAEKFRVKCAESVRNIQCYDAQQDLQEKTIEESEQAFVQEYYREAGQDIEHFDSDCFRLLLGVREARTRGVYDEKGNKAGLLRQFIPGYHTFHDIQQARKKILNKDALLYSGVARIYAAAFVENDLNFTSASYGVVFNDYKEIPQCIRMNIWKKGCDLYKNSFPSEEVMEEQQALDEMNYIILLRLLIPYQTYELLAKADIISELMQKYKLRKKQAYLLEMKTQQLETPGFQAYVLNHQQALQDILSHFKRINQEYVDYTPNVGAGLIDLEDVKLAHAALVQDVKNRIGWRVIFTEHHKIGRFLIFAWHVVSYCIGKLENILLNRGKTDEDLETQFLKKKEYHIHDTREAALDKNWLVSVGKSETIEKLELEDLQTSEKHQKSSEEQEQLDITIEASEKDFSTSYAQSLKAFSIFNSHSSEQSKPSIAKQKSTNGYTSI